MLQDTTNDVVNKLATKNLDMRQRRIIDAADAVDTQDYVTLNDLNTKLAPSAYTDTTQANNVIKGILPNGVMPTPTPLLLGGIRSIVKVATKFIQWIDNNGNPQLAQPAFTDLSGSIAVGQIPGSVLPPSTQVLPARALGTVYQNTGTNPRYVSINWNSGVAPSRIDAYCDTNPAPGTTIVDIFIPTSNLNGAFIFIVLPNYYYKVTQSSGTIGITVWTEWQ